MHGHLDLSFKELLNALEKEHERSLQCLREENLQIRKLVKDSSPKKDKTSTKLLNDWDTIACGEDVGKATATNSISLTLDVDVEDAKPVELTDSLVGRSLSLASDLGLHICPVWTTEAAASSNHAGFFVGERLAMELFAKSKKIARKGTNDSLYNRLRNCPKEWSDVVMRPTSKKVMSWSILAVALLMYDFFFIPLQLAFQPAPSVYTRFLEWLTIFYWTLDILVNFSIGFYTNKGHLEKRFIPIAKRYMRSHFWLDIAIVSGDWLKVAFDYLPQRLGLLRAGKFIRFLRFTRSIRLVRLVRLQGLLGAILDFVNAESVMIGWDIGFKVVLLLAVNHFVACAWFLIGNRAHGWVRKARIEGGMWESYLISLHWALTSFTPAQKPAVHPATHTERAFAVCLILFAMVCMSTFVSSITSQMTRLRQLKTSSIAQYFNLRKFLGQKGITTDLSARITRYVQVAKKKHEQRLSRDKVGLLKYLSGPLSVELESEIYSPSLCRHPFFELYRERNPSSMGCVCYAAVHQEAYSKGDHIFSYGRESAHMYFLHTGCLYYMRPKNLMWDNGPDTPTNTSRVLVVNEGHWFCEATLWVLWTHRGTMGTLIESEAIQLNSCKFQQITKEHSDVYERCRTWANDFLISLKETYQCHGCLWDLPPETVYSNSSDIVFPVDLDDE